MSLKPLPLLVIAALWLLVVDVVVVADKDRSPAQFRCILCEEYVYDAILTKSLAPEAACKKTLNGCSFLSASHVTMVKAAHRAIQDEKAKHGAGAVLTADVLRGIAYGVCLRENLCEGSPVVPKYDATSSLPDIKVSNAYGGRNSYGTVRLTLIDALNTTRDQSFVDFFQYNGPFHYRWTEYILRTALVNVTPGVPTTITVGGVYNMTVSVPAPDASIRGVFVADPCYSSRFMICIYGGLLHIQERLSAILSSLGNFNGVDFYGVIGDNFYDRDGSLAPPFFNSLSDSIKSKHLITVPGNHDFWMMGSPWLAQPSTDSNGNGFMQYYGQDVTASVTTFPYNFSVDPDNESIWNHYDRMPSYANFFFYHRLGPVGIIGYSGAHILSDMLPKLEEACLYMQEQQVSWVILIGHWNTAGDGAELDATTNFLYHSTLINLPGCQQLGTKRIKYMLGHTHCNVIDDVNRGFMVGGFGMGGGAEDCGDFGIPYIEASASQLLVTYFPITHRFDWWEDQYDQVMNCIQSTAGLSGCRQLGRTWLNATL